MLHVYDVTKYRPSFHDQLFFDNNIWLFLFCPLANYKKEKQRIYSNFLKNVKQSNCAVFINSLILSEFCNYWLQTEFKKWKIKNPSKTDYKRDFIPTELFRQAVLEVKAALKNILEVAEKNNDDFNAINFESVLTELSHCDFNDSYYLELAHFKNWKIVTDDADLYKNNNLNIEIITANI